MADEMSMALAELLGKIAMNSNVLREGVRLLAQVLMELEVTQRLEAGRHERTDERTGQRNGYRERQGDTRVGTIDLRVPRVRDGGDIPSLLEPRRRSERALLAVVQEAYMQGVPTRRVDTVVQALGMEGISKSQISRVCQDLDREGEAFRTRQFKEVYPYVWLDATYIKVRINGRVVPRAVVIAVGVRMCGERAVLGVDVGTSEEGAFWQQFLRSLVARGLRGVQLVISDAHEGLKGAIANVFGGATWPRCKVHFMRNALSSVPKAAQGLVATRSAPSSPSRTRRGRAPSGVTSPTASAIGSRVWRRSWTTPRTTCWPTWRSRPSTGGRSGATIPRSGSTARSSGAPMWSTSSLTRRRCCGWSGRSWASSTTSGRSGGAT